MSFCQIAAHVTIDHEDASEVTEALLRLIDSFVIKNIPVFDSEVLRIDDVVVVNPDEIREEVQSNSP